MSKSPEQVATQYRDIKPILDQCLLSSGGTYNAPTPGNAVQFRHRCYAFRKAYREAVAPAASPYDLLTIRKLPKGATQVVIAPVAAPGTFTPAGGAPIETYQVPDNDPLLDEAAALREKLGVLDLD